MPGPKCYSDLQKVPLACEEVPHGCDKRAQFHSVLLGSRGPGVLLRASTTKATRQTTLTAQSRGIATYRISRNTSAHVLSFEIFVVQIPVATRALKSLPAARRQNRVAARAFRAES